MFDSITIHQDNITGGANLLASQSPLAFIVNVNYSGPTPEACNVEIYNSSMILLDTYKLVPYRDTLNSQRQFLFKADQIVRSMLGNFDDFPQNLNTLEYVEGLTKELTLRFVDPDNPSTYVETIIDFVHAARQYGESPCLQGLFNNENDIYFVPRGKSGGVYFYNDDPLNNIAIATDSVSIAYSQNPLYFPKTLMGNQSPEQALGVYGYNLSGDITLTASEGFLLSLVSGSGYASSVVIPVTGSSVTDTVYIVFAPTEQKAYNVVITPLVGGSPVSGFNLSLIGTSEQTVISFTDPGTFYWTCPAGVSSLKVECYGGGGSGYAALSREGAGGAGGQYARIDFVPLEGREYRVIVAHQTNAQPFPNPFQVGNDSSFLDPVLGYLCVAKGGATGYFTVGGLGSVVNGIGDVVYKGGDGGDAVINSYGGPGGGGAGPNGDGFSYSGVNGGAGNGGLAGKGGDAEGSTDIDNNGVQAGGGGGGAGVDLYYPDRAPGKGAKGAVILTY